MSTTERPTTGGTVTPATAPADVAVEAPAEQTAPAEARPPVETGAEPPEQAEELAEPGSAPERGSAVEAESAADRRRRLARRLLPELAWAATSAVLAVLGMAAVIRLWKGNLNIPLSSAGDVMLSLMVVKNMQVTGWFQTTPYLGYPFGQDLAAYPSSVGDFWHMVVLKVLSLFLTPAAAVNVFYVGGFAVVAVFAYGALRWLRISRPLSCALAVTYALIPYHFLRGESHLLLSAYYALPVAVVLAVAIYTGRSSTWISHRRPTAAGWAALAGAVLLAGTGLYYAVFALVLIAAAGVLASLASNRTPPLLSAIALCAVIGAGLGLGALPNLLFQGVPGSAFAVDGRSYGATEFYGLKITNLLLPFGLHRVQALADLRGATADSPIPGEGSETLGILGVAGLVIIVVAVLLPRIRARMPLAERFQPLGVLALVAILCGTVAGLNSLLAVMGFAQLRAWNRISILIAFLALAGLGLALDATLRRVRWRRPRSARITAVGVAGALMLVALFDQTSDALIPDYPSTAAGWNSDAAYFASVQDELGAGAPVFQLPYAPFPENPPIADMTDYSHLRGYLHSDLKWSYGGVKGQESEWQPVALENGITSALPLIVGAGFEGLYINRLGYVDRGAAVEAQILAEIGPQVPLVNADKTLVTYDQRPYAERLRAAGAVPDNSAIFSPVRLVYGAGCYLPEASGADAWHWAQATATVSVTNPADEDRTVRVTGEVRVATPGASVTIEAAGTTQHLTAGPEGSVAVDVELPVGARGEAPMTFTTDSAPTPTTANDPRDLRQQLLNLQVVQLAG
jgi:hypothetical protein